MPSPHYPSVRLTAREGRNTEDLITKALALMRRRGVPKNDRIAFGKALDGLPYDEALAEARKWIVVITPETQPRWDLTKVVLRPNLGRETLVLNPNTQFAGLGFIPTLHLRTCPTVKQASHTKAFNATAKTAFESEKARRAAGGWPSLAFCRRCLVDKVRYTAAELAAGADR